MLVSDTVLNIKVKGALHGDPDVGELGVRVHVLDGVVTLEGSAPNERLKELAGEIAESVHGVDEVDNRIRVNFLSGRELKCLADACPVERTFFGSRSAKGE